MRTLNRNKIQGLPHYLLKLFCVIQSLLLTVPVGLYSVPAYSATPTPDPLTQFTPNPNSTSTTFNSSALAGGCTYPNAATPQVDSSGTVTKGPCNCGDTYLGSGSSLGTYSFQTSAGSGTTCSNYSHSATQQASVSSTDCGPSPGPSSSCANTIASDYAGINTYCQAIDFYQTATTVDFASMVVYSAAAGVCGAACVLALDITFGGPAAAAAAAPYAVLDPICIALEFGTLATDITDVSIMGAKANSDGQNWNHTEVNGIQTSSDIAAGITGAVGILKLTTKVVGKASARAGQEAAESASIALTCLGAGLLIAAATLKGYNIQQDRCNECQVCDTILLLNTGLLPSTLPSTPPPPNNGGGAGGIGGAAPAPTAAAGTTSGGSNPAVDKMVAGGSNPFPSGQLAAATAGGTLGGNPNLGQLPNALKTIGSSLGAVANQLAAGASPSSVIAGMLPDQGSDDVAAMVKDIDAMAKNGQIGLANSTFSHGGGGSRSTASAANPMFGSRAAAMPTAAKEMGFDKSKPALEPSDTDIWHADWKGSIFQIVSFKLKKSRERIDQLEWVSPLNRALMGLSNKATPQTPNAPNPSHGGVK